MTAPDFQDFQDYEDGTMEDEERIIKFFQSLIDTGFAWKLQGSYGRAAMGMIKDGLCVPAKTGGNKLKLEAE